MLMFLVLGTFMYTLIEHSYDFYFLKKVNIFTSYKIGAFYKGRAISELPRYHFFSKFSYIAICTYIFEGL